MKNIIFSILLLIPFLCNAQKWDRVWVFDDSVAIDWNNIANPQVYQIGTQQVLDENYASICDKDGNLVFYVGGVNQNINSFPFSAIYGKNENKIINGDSIFCGRSVTQGFLFIPNLNDTNKFYFFYVDPEFHYGILDKSANVYGSCISRDIQLDTISVTEKLTAIKHGNGVDWWILIHKYNSNEFHEFLLTSSGISGPIIQPIGPLLNYQGQMRFSPNGSKLGMVDPLGIVSLFNFDRCSGVISNYVNLGNDAAYGCSFSSNSQVFYASTYNKLFQYDLDSVNIASTKLLLWNDSIGACYISQHLLAANNKIYIASSYGGPNQIFTYRNMNLTVISNPNIYGVGCNVQPYSFYLNGLRCLAGLPNIVNYNLGPLVGSPCDTIPQCQTTQSNNVASICSGESYNFNGNTLTTAGVYADTLLNVGGCDSVISLQLSVISNTSSSSTEKICEGDSVTIGSNTYYIAGTYIDTLINNAGCDSIVTSIVQVDSVSASIAASADTLTAASTGIVNYKWYNCDSSANISGATNQTYVATTTGHYAVWVTDAQGCSKLSACVFIEVSGMEQLIIDNGEWTIYPNPTDNQLTVYSEQLTMRNIEIVDVLGRTIIRDQTNLKSKILNLKSFSAGVYFVKVQMSDGSFGVKKFVKE